MLGEEGFVDAEKKPAAAQNEKNTKDDVEVKSQSPKFKAIANQQNHQKSN
jgi:hypothetical protein